MKPVRFHELTRDESLRRLASVRVGRIVFTHQALPAIRPVHHVVDAGQVIIHGHPGAPLLSALDTVVAYEADGIGADDTIGWSVVVTGVARKIAAGEVPERYQDPWDDDEASYLIRIRPELVSGFGLPG
ncbi:pyridoxamine 5'-phosphate oxidase family protein [Amycolatopsis sp. RM579]|uniref:Pyridoxamine 5'-phosphate oxidase family protein n=2 Tax=Amycolatopsis pithecellobii TaxID=664692 RepID=A0A6N7ZCC3_9PSEU|nr:pyridoxamine 5'-phosphate oxidase family protein [Amycolatopsis pithecellobii]